jgi:hypothetical protein
LREGADNLNLQVFVGGPMTHVAPERLKALAAQVVAEDAPATVAFMGQLMSKVFDKTS